MNQEIKNELKEDFIGKFTQYLPMIVQDNIFNWLDKSLDLAITKTKEEITRKIQDEIRNETTGNTITDSLHKMFNLGMGRAKGIVNDK